MNPPAIPIAEKVRELARRAVARAAAVARVSAWTMLVLGGLSVAVSVASPIDM